MVVEVLIIEAQVAVQQPAMAVAAVLLLLIVAVVVVLAPVRAAPSSCL